VNIPVKYATQTAVIAASEHTTIVPQSRHKRYSTVNAILTPNTE